MQCHVTDLNKNSRIKHGPDNRGAVSLKHDGTDVCQSQASLNSRCLFSQIQCFSSIQNTGTVPVLKSFRPVCQTQTGQEDGPFSLYRLSRHVLVRPNRGTVSRGKTSLCIFVTWNIRQKWSSKFGDRAPSLTYLSHVVDVRRGRR